MNKFIVNFALGVAVFAFTVFIALSTLIPAGECYRGSADSFDSITISYTVKKGDTLYDISRKYRIGVHELMSINNLKGDLIKPGDILILSKKFSPKSHLSRGNMSISREDLMLLARVIHAEARGESFEGKVAVGAVILNRLASPYFPKTIKEIIYQKNNHVYQFSPVRDGSINLQPDEKAIQAAVQALSGVDPTNGSLFFYNPDISKDQWIRTLPVVTRIGNHVFATCS